MFSHSSCLGEACAGRVGPLARGTFDCLSRDPALPGAPSSRCRRGREGGAPSRNPAARRPAALPAAAFCGLASRAPNALYTEFGQTPPVSLTPPTLRDARGFSTALERGFHGGRGPGLFPSHSSWSRPLRGHRALPRSPCLPGDIGADFHVASVGLGELYKH